MPLNRAANADYNHGPPAGHIRFRDFVLMLCLLSLSSYVLVAQAKESKRATAKADAWIGRDAADLLTQLRVDGGRVQIDENDETGETSYTWETWNPDWVENRVVGSEIAPGPGGIFHTTYTQDVYHPATVRCIVTFHADKEGIVRRWDYEGDTCSRDVEKPKE